MNVDMQIRTVTAEQLPAPEVEYISAQVTVLRLYESHRMLLRTNIKLNVRRCFAGTLITVPVEYLRLHSSVCRLQ
eukprot:SAG31_NODE_486_length_15001_cov_8.454405_4_plen_75_part_00